MNITLEDALMSFESMRLMMGGKLNAPSETTVIVNMTEQATVKEANTVPKIYDHLDASITYTLPASYRYINFTTGVRGEVSGTKTFIAAAGDTVRFFWEMEIDQETDDGFNAYEITISPNTFPGTWTF